MYVVYTYVHTNKEYACKMSVGMCHNYQIVIQTKCLYTQLLLYTQTLGSFGMRHLVLLQMCTKVAGKVLLLGFVGYDTESSSLFLRKIVS
jgi:hypothetical protein